MKLLICLILFFGYSNGQGLFFRGIGNFDFSKDLTFDMSEQNGPLHKVLSSPLVRCIHNSIFAMDTSAMTLRFSEYSTSREIFFPIVTAGSGISNIEGLKKNNKFVVFIPGFTTDFTVHSLKLMRESFRDDTYVITLHDPVYTNLFNSGMLWGNYERAVMFSYSIAVTLADVLVTLSNNGVSPNHMHIIGHSLGAHIAGYVGENFLQKKGRAIARITGLDPINPCFQEKENHLRSGQAKFVDVYHSNAYELGTSKSLGDVNIFINDGITQPNCVISPIPDVALSSASALCSHMSSENFFFLTVKQPTLFPAYMCNDYAKFNQGRCNNHRKISAGYYVPTDATGIYYTSTGSQAINQV